MVNEDVSYKILYNANGEAIGAEDSNGNPMSGTEPPTPFHVERIVELISESILITEDAEKMRHCWRRIGRKIVCVSC
jgi:hypothetical protein